MYFPSLALPTSLMVDPVAIAQKPAGWDASGQEIMKELGDLEPAKRPGFFKRTFGGLGDHKTSAYLSLIITNYKKFDGTSFLCCISCKSLNKLFLSNRRGIEDLKPRIAGVNKIIIAYNKMDALPLVIPFLYPAMLFGRTLANL